MFPIVKWLGAVLKKMLFLPDPSYCDREPLDDWFVRAEMLEKSYVTPETPEPFSFAAVSESLGREVLVEGVVIYCSGRYIFLIFSVVRDGYRNGIEICLV